MDNVFFGGTLPSMKRAFFAAALAAAIVAGAAAASGPTLTNPSSLHDKAPATFSAKFVTTKGDFVVSVTRSWAPIGADRFYNLVKYHFYDNQPIFRVQPGFLVQWGINMKPPVAKAWKTAYIKDEPMVHKDATGTIAFAHVLGVKNSRTTQLFVNLKFNNLGPSFPAFGTITSGLDVFKKFYNDGGKANANQAGMTKYGAWWVHKYFPKLDWIKTATLVR